MNYGNRFKLSGEMISSTQLPQNLISTITSALPYVHTKFDIGRLQVNVMI